MRQRIWPDGINDKDSALVADALTRKCFVCGAAPGVLCTNVIDHRKPLPDRLIHFGRTVR